MNHPYLTSFFGIYILCIMEKPPLLIQVLEDQMTEKAVNKAKLEAEKVTEMMAEVDEKKVMEEEEKE